MKWGDLFAAMRGLGSYLIWFEVYKTPLDSWRDVLCFWLFVILLEIYYTKLRRILR